MSRAGGRLADHTGTVSATKLSRRDLAVFAVPAVLAYGCLGVALVALASGKTQHGWAALTALAFASVLAQVARPGRPHAASDRTAIAFAAAGALLLTLPLLLVLVVGHVVASWLGERRTWVERLIDLGAAVLASLGAWMGWELATGGRPAAGALLACALAVLCLYAVRLPAIRAATGERAPVTFESVAVDLVLAALGIASGVLWTIDPWLTPLALGPLLLVQRSLAVPQLVAESRIDAKTGLYNARWFARALEEELGRSARFDRPLSLIMADLDLLRDINNAHGHLAGDAVLQGVAGIFQAQLRHYDVPARFGGEEFSIILPETRPELAYEIAERIRRAVEARLFRVETSPDPIRATVSIGVAGFPANATGATELVHRADLAVYDAKLAGRNRTVLATGEAAPSAPVTHLAVPDATPVLPTASRRVKPAVERRRQPRPGPVRSRLIDAMRAPASPVAVAAAGGALAGATALVTGVLSTSLEVVAGASLYAGAVFVGPLVLLRRAQSRARAVEDAAELRQSAPAVEAPKPELEQAS